MSTELEKRLRHARELHAFMRANECEVVHSGDCEPWGCVHVIVSPPVDQWPTPDTEIRFIFACLQLDKELDDISYVIEPDGFYTRNDHKQVTFTGWEPVHQFCANQICELVSGW